MGGSHRAGINASFLLLWEMSREEKAERGLKWGETYAQTQYSEEVLGRNVPVTFWKVTNSASNAPLTQLCCFASQ